MKYTATFDMGTTAVKGVLVSDDKKVVFQYSLPVDTLLDGDYKEQAPEQWHSAFCEISKIFFKEGFKPEDIRGIVMSGQMQDLIPIDVDGRPVRNAILYSDGRAVEEAAEITARVGEERIKKITGNAMDGSIPAAKLLWYRKHEHENFARTAVFLGSSKDYSIYKLTGKYVADVTAAATFGLMDIHAKKWDAGLLAMLDIKLSLLPKIYYCHNRVGGVTAEAAKETGYAEGTPVYGGSGDAGASTLASGVSKPGEYNIYLGTSGWIASISDDILLRSSGVFNLAAIPEGMYINVVPFLNAGAVHKWVSSVLWPMESGEDMYGYINSLLERSEPGSNGLLFLPYLSGERFPVLDAKIRGCYLGINNATTRADMARACLEGVAFSIRQGLEAMSDAAPTKISLVGGGAKAPIWRQILADTLASPIVAFEESAEYLPSIAIASSVFIEQGLEESYDSFVSSIISGSNTSLYEPSAKAVEVMEVQYQRYKKVYPAVKDLF